ncbi:hypothetical protein [Streptomyces sp. B1I3]|uniref:hypothetical protein n=1 Tax=Streptomyces sp. B1I3 TaxID=3042264 RepID=UPI002781DF33|nr:hypothetical protein [Streptomyces sp. B1I3]MDQ0794033.1 hypothetical protein [Streptomyces sp. B1I3]
MPGRASSTGFTGERAPCPMPTSPQVTWEQVRASMRWPEPLPVRQGNADEGGTGRARTALIRGSYRFGTAVRLQHL